MTSTWRRWNFAVKAGDSTRTNYFISNLATCLGDSPMTNLASFNLRPTPLPRGFAADDIALHKKDTTQGATRPPKPELGVDLDFKIQKLISASDTKKTQQQTATKANAITPESKEALSSQLSMSNSRIGELEARLALLEKPAHQPDSTVPQKSSGTMKKCALAVKTAFANAPWEKIGKGALYATVAVAAFAVLSNPIGAISAVGMLLGSSLLPTAIGLAGAGYAVHKTHQWLNKKPDQDSPAQGATASHHGDGAFSQSLGNRA
jgi:hypothetical protein